MKTVVIYYSLTGKSEAVARGIAQALKGELFRVESTNPERVISLDTFKMGFSSRILHEPFESLRRRRARLKIPRLDFKGFTRVIVVTPIWGAFFPPTMNTFLELNNFKGKKVAVIAIAPPFANTSKVLDYAERQFADASADLIYRNEVRIFQQSKQQLFEQGTLIGTLLAQKHA